MKTSVESTYKNKGRTLGWGGGPDADWRVMFGTFSILLVISLALCFVLYANTRDGEDIGEGGVESPLNEARLKRVSGFYQKQKIDFESALRVPETIPDPSK